MIHRSKPLCAAVVSAALAGTGASAWGDGSAQEDVLGEIQALKARIEQLESRQKQQQEENAKNDERAAFEDVSNDADRRSRLFDETGFSAGYKNNRFYIASEDGNFVLRPWLHLQIRNATVWRRDFRHGGEDDIQNGFEIRRMKLGFDGNLFTPDLAYFFNWATSRTNGTPVLEEAWLKYHFPTTSLYVKAGQIKDPLLHDQIVSSRYQQSAERSLTADIFANGDAFTKGATIIYDPKTWLRTEVGVNDGLRSANTNFQDYPTNPFDWGVAGRAEFRLFGRWQDYGQVGAVDVKEPLLVIGIGADSSQRGHATQTVAALDAQYADPAGLNFYGAIVNRYTNHNFGIATQSGQGASFISNPDPAVLGTSTNEYSFLLQAGYLLPNHVEPFGRYEYMHLAGTPAGSRNDLNVITAGVNYYWYGHRAKVTAEVQYLPQGLPIDNTSNDLLATPNGHGELSGIVQFQLLL